MELRTHVKKPESWRKPPKKSGDTVWSGRVSRFHAKKEDLISMYYQRKAMIPINQTRGIQDKFGANQLKSNRRDHQSLGIAFNLKFLFKFEKNCRDDIKINHIN
jgi:hypothetical protein